VSVPKVNKAEGLMWIEIALQGEKIFIAVIYLAPGIFPKVKEVNERLFEELSEDINFFCEQGRIILVGDFN
jgi:hypothetical protein